MGCDLVLCARTDAMSATFLDSNIDPIDHPFILGCVDPKDSGKLLTFPQAGRIAIVQNFRGEQRDKMIKLWDNHCLHMSLSEAQDMARKNGFEFYFDWESCRTEEGYYRIEGSVPYCIKRGLVFADYADMLWMETPTPDLSVAKEFADGIHSVKPHVFLSYNLSPSFNWDAQKMSE
jgi:isocitrate lyase